MTDPAATRAFKPADVVGFDAERATFRASVFGCRFHLGHCFGVGLGMGSKWTPGTKKPRECRALVDLLELAVIDF